MLSIAIVCSAHGYGHLTRSLEVAAALRRCGADPTLFTATPGVALDWDPTFSVEHMEADVGFVQSDGFTEDVSATAELLATRCSEAAVDAMAEHLARFDGVVVDIPPAALEASRRAGVPAIAVGNFDWAWVYSRYEGLGMWAERFARWQSGHPAIQLWPGPGLRGFSRVQRGGMIARRAPADSTVRPGSVLVAFSAHGLPGASDVLPRIPGTVWIVDDALEGARNDFEVMGRRRFPGLVAAVDVVVTKPGYGILAESMLAGARIAWVPRGSFPEASSLEAILRGRADPVIESLTPAGISAAIQQARSLGRPDPVGEEDEAARVAASLIEFVRAK